MVFYVDSYHAGIVNGRDSASKNVGRVDTRSMTFVPIFMKIRQFV
jgi:hypothetical protein